MADDPGRIRNTHIMLDNEGTVRGLYHKLHLFSVDIPGSVQLNEAAGCRPGTHITPPIATPIGNVAMSIVSLTLTLLYISLLLLGYN